jgi:hypothetical protein
MTEPSRGPNGTLQKWHVYVTLASVVLACFSVAFKAGFSDAQINGRMNAIEKHLDNDDMVFVRADVVNAKLSTVEEMQHRIEGMQDQQSKTLEEMLLKRQ